MIVLKGQCGLTKGWVMTKNTQNLWVGTIHECASAHPAMCEGTRQHHATRTHYVKCGKTK